MSWASSNWEKLRPQLLLSYREQDCASKVNIQPSEICLFFFPFIARAIPLKQQRAVAMMCIYTQRFEKQVRKIEVMLYFDAKLSQYYPIAKYTMEVGDKTYLLLALSWSLVLK